VINGFLVETRSGAGVSRDAASPGWIVNRGRACYIGQYDHNFEARLTGET
jgi:hypothetical protein